jgi:aminopeptidase YwaD
LKFITRIMPVMVFLIFFSCTSKHEVTVNELHDHIEYLSSDSLKGRLAGSSGDSLAAEYIKHELSSYGLIPLSGDGFQRFRVTSRLVSGPGNALAIDGKSFILEKDFTPFAFSSISQLESEVIFVGYGFDIDADSLKWNDYENINVEGKWVMSLRADPETEKSISPFVPFSGDRDKALSAKDLGAAGVLLVSGPSFDPQDTFESLNSEEFSVDIPVLRIKRDVADIILSKAKISVASLEKKLNDTRKPSSFTTGTVVNAKAEIIRELHNTRNVVMILPGEDEILKNEYIIIGAHFDHLGMGGTGSRAADTVAVHHGADDNASGVSMMLELAEKFAHTRGSHKRSIIFIAFTGEEEGLLGSKFFVDSTEIDLTKVNAMINLDMVGRLQKANVLQVSGVGTADDLKELVIAENDTNLIKLTLSEGGYGPSDHSSFYGKNIPVLFFSTGAHLDYHTPDDTYDKLNYDGMVNISSLIFDVTEKLASSPDRLRFREAGQKPEQGRQIRRKGVTIGIMPDFAGNIKNGLRADFVIPGRPAALGGMIKGDIITAINGKAVNNIYDYMSRMGQLKHGQTISVEITRNNQKMLLLIQL